MGPPLVTVVGEALIDLVPADETGDYRAHPGGSPFNVAVALARLRQPTTLMARIADRGFGRLLRKRAADEGIDLSAAPHAGEPTTLAVVSLNGAAQASYEFYVEGTADWQWTMAELRRLPSDTEVLHFGSIASWTGPASERIDQVVHKEWQRDHALVSYDPNVRPPLLASPARGQKLVERSIRRAHLVKASREDLEWLYPSRSFDQVCSLWHQLGPALVVVTDGALGAVAYRAGRRPLSRPGRPVNLVDTIGAGDSFTAGLLSGLLRRGLHRPEGLHTIADAVLGDVIDEAALISSITCERAGADPPKLAHSVAAPTAISLDDLVTT